MNTFLHTSYDTDLRLVSGQRGVCGHGVIFFVGGNADLDNEYRDELNAEGAYSSDNDTSNKAIYCLDLDDEQAAVVWHRDLQLDDAAFAEIRRAVGHAFREQFDREMTRDEAEGMLEDPTSGRVYIDGEDFELNEADDEWGWTIQGIQARAARRQGFLFVESRDEQGPVFFADFTGRFEIFNDNVRRLN